MKSAQERFIFRRKRVRSKISGTASCPRLSVYRGHRHIYAQLIDDEAGRTILSVSTLSPEMKSKVKVTDTIPAAKAVGEAIAKKAVEKGITSAVFDRAGYVYTGRIKALADAARQGGLKF